MQIPSVTGIDLELNIAGPGGRAYAFVIDWHIRLLLALAWFIAASFISSGTINIFNTTGFSAKTYAFSVFLPCAALYLLYHPVLEILMRGQTPGKRMAKLRIVTLEGETPGTGALFVRNLLRVLDSMPIGYMIGLLCTVLTKNSVRIGDLAAGTLLIYSDVEHTKTINNLGFNATLIEQHGLVSIELIQELLERWQQLVPDTRSSLAYKLLKKIGKSPPENLSEDALLEYLQKLTEGHSE